MNVCVISVQSELYVTVVISKGECFWKWAKVAIWPHSEAIARFSGVKAA